MSTRKPAADTAAAPVQSSAAPSLLSQVTAKDALPLYRLLALSMICILGAFVEGLVFSRIDIPFRVAFATRLFSVLRYESVIHEVRTVCYYLRRNLTVVDLVRSVLQLPIDQVSRREWHLQLHELV